jgi:hypothetical protein
MLARSVIFGAMRKIQHIQRIFAATLFAVIALLASGSYVAYFSSCEGMQKSSVSINELSSCCCSDALTADEISCTSESLSEEGCCSVSSKVLSVDDYSFSPKRVLDDGGSMQRLFTHSVFTLVAVAPPTAYGCWRDDIPPDKRILSGTDIIFGVTRQLRL